MGEDQHSGQDGPCEIGGDHQPLARVPVGDHPRDRSEQQHWHHFECHGGGHAAPGPGQPEHQHDDGDGVERVSGAGDAVGIEVGDCLNVVLVP